MIGIYAWRRWFSSNKSYSKKSSSHYLQDFFLNSSFTSFHSNDHIGGNVIGVPMVVLQSHIKEPTPLHVAISHKMSCELGFVILEIRSHHMKKQHAEEGNEEMTLLFWLPFELLQMRHRWNALLNGQVVKLRLQLGIQKENCIKKIFISQRPYT